MNKKNVVQSFSKLNLDELHILVKIQRDLHNYDTAEAKASIQELITSKLELSGELYKINN
tara:strand:+ start:2888 stop:3067 length:180 start_codon:yes stop_codon:yes gene_type:complete